MRDGMREQSITRMDEIAAFFAKLPNVFAIVAFGSNAKRERFDDCSDLDFLVLVEPKAKSELLGQVYRLDTLCPIDAIQIVYGDAVKLLFADGVFCDFGVVTPEQLTTFPHGAGRYLWCRDGWVPVDVSASEPPRMAENDLVLSALFHLYIGLLRVARGEEAAAFFEIQVTAAEHVLTLLEGEKADAFSPLRRAEKLLPLETIQSLMPGYGHTRKAAGAMLTHLLQAKDTPLYQAVDALFHALTANGQAG